MRGVRRTVWETRREREERGEKGGRCEGERDEEGGRRGEGEKE